MANEESNTNAISVDGKSNERENAKVDSYNDKEEPSPESKKEMPLSARFKTDSMSTVPTITPKRVIKPLDYADRKNSNSDLHSRLKTRKVLGVGESRDDREVYRSKISQILGQNDFLCVKLPKGLLCWHWTNFIYFFSSGLICLVMPKTVCFFESIQSDATYPIRLYGSSLIGYSLIYKFLMSNGQRTHVSISLKSAITVFGLQFIATALHLRTVGVGDHRTLVPLCLRLLGLVGNVLFHESSNPSISRWLKRYTSQNQFDLSDNDRSSGSGFVATDSAVDSNVANEQSTLKTD